eukprot:TRINITY_DN45697_c0_g1_i1.p1 TRINITY_DN45697_c0_g1~~TRINITY_DN45697_c0_g1_i1.p1  ORF type:complete len:181 (+),score=23.84 TRINITY_DN45697_c0_g1_i1:157-699(+)
MGATGSTYVCQVGPDAKEEAEFRPPWALAQADGFATEDCPFCALRRSHLSWLNTEIKRLTSEVAVLETTIPPKFHQELLRRLEERPLPDSMYTGGVDDVRGTGCTLCIDMRQQVGELQKKAQQLDSQGKVGPKTSTGVFCSVRPGSHRVSPRDRQKHRGFAHREKTSGGEIVLWPTGNLR